MMNSEILLAACKFLVCSDIFADADVAKSQQRTLDIAADHTNMAVRSSLFLSVNNHVKLSEKFESAERMA